MGFDEVLARCIERWQCEGIRLGPPIEEDEVRFVWGCLGRRASRDVIRLYGTVGGFAAGSFAEEFFWFFWAWEEIPDRNAGTPRTGVRFCDHSIEVAVWEMRFEDEGRSSVWRVVDSDPAEPARRVAPDLESFFRTYLDDPWELLVG